MINNTKESWENTITLISSLLGDSYIVKRIVYKRLWLCGNNLFKS